jgi:hypothetical protein
MSVLTCQNYYTTNETSNETSNENKEMKDTIEDMRICFEREEYMTTLDGIVMANGGEQAVIDRYEKEIKNLYEIMDKDNESMKAIKRANGISVSDTESEDEEDEEDEEILCGCGDTNVWSPKGCNKKLEEKEAIFMDDGRGTCYYCKDCYPNEMMNWQDDDEEDE